MAKFKEVIECLKNGGTASRQAWDVYGNREIMMQIPQRIAKDIVPKMTSVQSIIKPKISTVGSGEIEYHDQVIIIDFEEEEKTPARATYYTPSWEDIFADDWRLFEEVGTYIARMATEREELSVKAAKLNDFLCSEPFNNLYPNMRRLMERQEELLNEYINVLDERIKMESVAQG